MIHNGGVVPRFHLAFLLEMWTALLYETKGVIMILLKGDCLVEMDKIPDGSVDAIICDPPYGTTACKWDSVIPFEPMWKQLNRIIKANGAIVLFGSEPFSSALRMSNIKNYKYDWVWNKLRGTDFVLANKKPLKSFENIIIFYKKAPTYNPQMVKRDKILDTRNWKQDKMKGSEHENFSSKKATNKKIYTHKFPLTVIDLHKDKAECNGTKRLHPTQKPVELMEYLIKTYTNENETVLDFTMGSGSTGVACVNTNRKFIGIEMDDKYFEIAKKRISDAQEQMTLSFV